MKNETKKRKNLINEPAIITFWILIWFDKMPSEIFLLFRSRKSNAIHPVEINNVINEWHHLIHVTGTVIMSEISRWVHANFTFVGEDVNAKSVPATFELSQISNLVCNRVCYMQIHDIIVFSRWCKYLRIKSILFWCDHHLNAEISYVGSHAIVSSRWLFHSLL